MLLAKEQGGSDIDIMESMLEKVKDVLGSLDKDTDMTEVIESFMATNEHGRHLQSFRDELLNQLAILGFAFIVTGQILGFALAEAVTLVYFLLLLLMVG